MEHLSLATPAVHRGVRGGEGGEGVEQNRCEEKKSSLTSVSFATTAQEAVSDEMAEMTLQPLSLLPIYLALQPTAHVSSGDKISADGILEGVAKLVPGAEENERVVQAAHEVARAEGGELHNVAALVGGMVAQELIKIVTKQYIPIDNTCVFDGINSRTQVLRL